LILTASKSWAVLCAFEELYFFFLHVFVYCPAYAHMFCPFSRRYIHSYPVEIHTFLVAWAADWSPSSVDSSLLARGCGCPGLEAMGRAWNGMAAD
jgi:hypothetical protein